jgi:hypothetical protein
MLGAAGRADFRETSALAAVSTYTYSRESTPFLSFR